MDPNLKLVLDEIQKNKEDFNRRFDEHDARWERRFSELEHDHTSRNAAVDKRLDELEVLCTDTAYTVGRRVATLEADRSDLAAVGRDDRVAALEVAATDLGTWRPEFESVVNELRVEVQKLAAGCDRQVP